MPSTRVFLYAADVFWARRLQHRLRGQRQQESFGGFGMTWLTVEAVASMNQLERGNKEREDNSDVDIAFSPIKHIYQTRFCVYPWYKKLYFQIWGKLIKCL